ncbi:hypothetical protein C9I57_24035 [Trinickia symbiotica]|uniref:Uncharacterized protein n=1 Tax=Trinickia symbiotica TaxID=863227 RepID=A0A2T3XP09_9BURK|nr:hypothetical protein [Trinickia symbiotica]PTB18254.1 hypothetical protein C9I57_24035 [Trinickia symbiotica]
MLSRSIDELSDEQIEQLRLLNRKLEEAQQWICQRAQRCLDDYFRAGGVEPHRYNDERAEGVEVEIEVTCVLRDSHPDYAENEDNVVATLSDTWCGKEPSLLLSDENWNEFRHCEANRLKDDRHCWLFHELTDHALHRDWDKALSIGSFWIDVKLIQQLEMKWK